MSTHTLKTLLACVALQAVLFITPTLHALEPAPPEMEKPGEHHQHLKMMTGTWDVKLKMHHAPGQVMDGTGEETARIQPGGFWLISNFTGTFAGMKFTGHGVLGYDAHKKRYTGVWTDSVASVMLHSEGHCEKNGRLNTMTGKAYDPMKKRVVTYLQVTKIKDANTKTFHMYDVSGKRKILMMEAVYKRRVEKNIKDAKAPAKFTHTIVGLSGAHYYLGGPQQARPPEGQFKPGTRIKLVRKNGSYSIVQSETGITAHVSNTALKPIGR
ncbi:MAG: DUF1579 domain-containing protein [Verrucomicrobia subdivision 3 bacterium]|nr:DUF1579 domain-containing protein [Limisphaerales bacterium]